MKNLLKLIVSVFLSGTFLFAYAEASLPEKPEAKAIIVFVWDGLRPDAVNAKNTPNLYALMQQGTQFLDQHSSYPTFTMMNAASFATGAFAGKTGFYGNTYWVPGAHGVDSSGTLVNFSAPVFTEDYHILTDINNSEPLLEIANLFTLAREKGYSTATIGKSGPAFMQDYQEQNTSAQEVVFDEKQVYPLSFAKRLQAEHYPLPYLSPFAYPKGQLVLAEGNGNPTGALAVATLKTISGQALGQGSYIYPEAVTSDPAATDVSPYSNANAYLMNTYLSKILPDEHPFLSVVWLRNPDTTEHNYGPGTPSYYSALSAQDQLLGTMMRALKQNNLWNKVDLIIVSDHGHSSVSGPLHLFPLRAIQNGANTRLDPQGYSVSGDVRTADLLHRAGFKHVYDGMGCEYDPTLSGIKADGGLVYPIKSDTDGSVCGKNIIARDVNGDRNNNDEITRYTTPSYQVPKKLPPDAVIIAENGGSSYLYVPSHNSHLIKALIRFLQSREVYGVVFVDARYGTIPGTFPLALVHLQNKAGHNPDIIVGMTFDAQAKIQGLPGIEFNVGGIDRGMHGSFSPIDVHNFMMSYGPDFRKNFQDRLPSGNVDVAPTLAYLLGLRLPEADGRVLFEALNQEVYGQATEYKLVPITYTSAQTARNLSMRLPTDPDGKDIDSGKSRYSAKIMAKELVDDQGQAYTYFDTAEALRN